MKLNGVGDIFGDTSYLDFMTLSPSEIPASVPATSAASSTGSAGSGIDWSGLITGVGKTALDIYKTQTAADLQKQQLEAQTKIAQTAANRYQALPAGYQYQANGQLVYTGQGGQMNSQTNKMLIYGILGIGGIAALYFATR